MARRASLAGPQSDVQGRMLTATAGTGTLTLGAAAPGATTFAAMPLPINDGDQVIYELIDVGTNPTAKEKGVGTYHAAGPTLSRDTVLWSTNGNALLNLSGTGYVFVTADDSGSASRLVLPSPLYPGNTFYVATNGSDSNNGTAGAPWATFAHAMAVLTGQLDFGGQTVTLQLVAGHANFTTRLVIGTWTGGGSLVIDLGGGSIAPAGQQAISVSTAAGGNVTVQNGTIGGGATDIGLFVVAPAQFYIGSGITLGACASNHIFVQGFAAEVNILSSGYGVGGTAANHYAASIGGVITNPSGPATVFVSPAVWNVSTFATADSEGIISVAGMSFRGNAPLITGTRYFANRNGIINTGGGGPTFFPGDAAGSTSNGGQYS